MRLSWLLLGVAGALLLPGCNDPDIDGIKPEEDDTGAVAGRVCAPSGDGWLENAHVYTNLLEDGAIVGVRETYTDRDGYFVLTRVPEAESVSIHVQKGTYQTSLEAQVRKGELTSLADPPCLDPLSINAAVVDGEYDSLSSMLDYVGISTYSLVDGTSPESAKAFFSSLDALLGYDLICVDGVMSDEGVADDPEVSANVAAYVEAGGSLLVTDWSYDLIERSFPQALNFLGDDAVLDAAELGVAGMVVGAQVVDQSLAKYIGKQNVDIWYDLNFWPIIEGAASQVVVHVSGNVRYYGEEAEEVSVPAPLLVSFSAGYGTVVFSSFRQESNQYEDMAHILQYMLYKL